MQEHEENKIKILKCVPCTEIFASNEEYTSHLEQHIAKTISVQNNPYTKNTKGKKRTETGKGKQNVTLLPNQRAVCNETTDINIVSTASPGPHNVQFVSRYLQQSQTYVHI